MRGVRKVLKRTHVRIAGKGETKKEKTKGEDK